MPSLNRERLQRLVEGSPAPAVCPLEKEAGRIGKDGGTAGGSVPSRFIVHAMENSFIQIVCRQIILGSPI